MQHGVAELVDQYLRLHDKPAEEILPVQWFAKLKAQKALLNSVNAVLGTAEQEKDLIQKNSATNAGMGDIDTHIVRLLKPYMLGIPKNFRQGLQMCDALVAVAQQLLDRSIQDRCCQ